MKKLVAIYILLLLCYASKISAQVDTTKRFNKGDQNASISASAKSNIPKTLRTTPVQSKYRPTDPIGDDQPDVLLDVPNLSVDDITLDVHNLVANVSLDARVANLVQLKAGVDVKIDSVHLNIKGVQATLLLIVRLDNVRAIIEKTLTTLSEHPEILDRLLSTVDNAVNTVGDVANTALQPGGVISQTVNTLGQTVQHTIDATGNILEKTLDNTGKILTSKSVGRLLDLPVLSETTNAAGQIVKRVKDTSGAVIELVVDKAGKIVNQTLISKGTN